jgi:hypothetical protein
VSPAGSVGYRRVSVYIQIDGVYVPDGYFSYLVPKSQPLASVVNVDEILWQKIKSKQGYENLDWILETHAPRPHWPPRIPVPNDAVLEQVADAAPCCDPEGSGYLVCLCFRESRCLPVALYRFRIASAGHGEFRPIPLPAHLGLPHQHTDN